jgi:hypothetical protein
MVRRTRSEALTEMEINDVLRIYDRVGGAKSPGAAARAASVTVNVGVANNYNDLLAAVTRAARDPGREGSDFPVYGSGVVPVPGGSAFRDGEVSGS